MSIYRLVVLQYSTTALDSTAPGSLNSPAAKRGFYALHVFPECTAAAVLVSLNARRVFATGRWGDSRSTDPKPEELGKTAAACGSTRL